MQYETLLENYTPELQLIDAIDMLTHFHPDAAEILDRAVQPHEWSSGTEWIN